MKKLLCILAFGLYMQNVFAEKYALIIAIGDYPSKTGWRKISSLNDVPLISQTLLDQKFDETNIKVLSNEKATYLGIRAALDTLLKRVKKGDIVVVHFSGHGQQIFDESGDEIDGKDEALVPYDAWVKYTYNYKGENHFRDDELGNYIRRFRNTLGKTGQLLLLLDSCHSGSTTRGGVARGSEAVFAPEGWSSKKNEKSIEGSDMSDEISKIRLKKSASPFVLISGAAANQLNYENKGVGSLSLAFSKAMSTLGSNFSYRQLFSRIEIEMSTIAPNQTPTIEGDFDVKLFNNEYVKQQPYFEIKSIPRPDIIKIQAGKIQGLFKNTTVNILPSGSINTKDNAIISKGRITLSRFNESIIKLDKPLTNNNIKNYWVFIDKPSYGEMSLQVFFDKSIQNIIEKDSISDFLKVTKLGAVVKDSAMSDIIISKVEDYYVLNSTQGFINIDNSTKTSEIRSIESLKGKLLNFAQGNYLKDLDLKNYEYEFDFRLLPINYDPILDDFKGYIDYNEFISENNIFQVKEEQDWVILEVTNKSKTPLYFSIIEINSQGTVSHFFPRENCQYNDNERRLLPGQTMKFEQCKFNFSPPYEKLVLKGFATPYPINFQKTVETRGASVNIENPLERFIANTYGNSRGSNATKSSTKIDGFSNEFIYEIVQEK
ncbi:MAG: caspase family protein [Jejuia sp.]